MTLTRARKMKQIAKGLRKLDDMSRTKSLASMGINATSIVPTEEPATIRQVCVLAILDSKAKIVEAMREQVIV